MKKTKTQKGITLVALIITIVVLLILAVTTIGAVRESGIIAHAQNAAKSYKEEQVKENSLLQEYEDVIMDQISQKWKFAYAVVDGTWTERITEQTDPKLSSAKIVAYFYEKDTTVTPYFALSNTTLPEGNAYKLEIKCVGTGNVMPDLMVGETSSPSSWLAWEDGVQTMTNLDIAYVDEVTIAEGITSIGAHAFSCAISLKNIEIPTTVTSIGDYAFNLCVSFATLTIPSTVTNIGIFAFDKVPHVSYTGIAADRNNLNWGAKSFN